MADGITRSNGGFPFGKNRYTRNSTNTVIGTAAILKVSMGIPANSHGGIQEGFALVRFLNDSWLNAVSNSEPSTMPPQIKISARLTSWLRKKLRFFRMPQ